MASILPRGVELQRVGTTASPIALQANDGAGANTETWTWNHNRAKRAERIRVLEATSRQEVQRSGAVGNNNGVIVTQPTTSQIVVVNQNDLAGINVVLEITWEDHTLFKMGSLAGTVGTLS